MAELRAKRFRSRHLCVRIDAGYECQKKSDHLMM
jgi:hypothetical protein